MRPCVRRFVTTFSSLLDSETSVVHSRQQGVGGFVGAQVTQVGRRPHPSRRHQRPVGIERPRGQALPEDAGAGGGEDAGGTGDWASPWYEVDVLDGPGPQWVQSRFDARGWSPTGRAAMETLLEAGVARGQRWAAVPALGGSNGDVTDGQPGEHGGWEGSGVSEAASGWQGTAAWVTWERQRQPAVQRAGDRRRAAAAGAQRREWRRLLAARPATLRSSHARAHHVYAGELGRARNDLVHAWQESKEHTAQAYPKSTKEAAVINGRQWPGQWLQDTGGRLSELDLMPSQAQRVISKSTKKLVIVEVGEAFKVAAQAGGVGAARRQRDFEEFQVEHGGDYGVERGRGSR
eukprot:COSAG02_NODE_1682_length_11342_cov_9.313795_3_plen_348_part_00